MRAGAILLRELAFALPGFRARAVACHGTVPSSFIIRSVCMGVFREWSIVVVWGRIVRDVPAYKV